MSSFIPMSYNTSDAYDFNKTYTPNKTLIDRSDFINKTPLLHNNVGHNVMNEHIVEYQVFVDSSNSSTYLDPFSFTVYFGDNVGKDYLKISKDFRNVKYINLEYVFLPKSNIIHIPTEEDPIYYMMVADEDGLMRSTHRFLYTQIDELSTDKVYMTANSSGSNSRLMMFPDRNIGGLYSNLWYPKLNSRVYPGSMLQTFSRLTIKICDEDGDKLESYDQDGNVINLQQLMLNNPSEDLIATYKEMNINLALKIAVVSCELNTSTSFHRGFPM